MDIKQVEEEIVVLSNVTKLMYHKHAKTTKSLKILYHLFRAE